MRILLFSVLLTLMTIEASYSQDPLFERTVKDLKQTRYGPNRQHFISPLLSFSTGLMDDKVHSHQFMTSSQLGLTYKFRLFSFLNLGLEAGFQPEVFYQSFSPASVQGDSITLISSSMRMQNVFENGFLRFRIGQRGNYLGNYIDLGFGLMQPTGLNSASRYLINTGGRSSIMVKKSKIPIPAETGYNGFLRIGFDRLALVLNVTAWNNTRIYKVGLVAVPIRY
jgi:hypothetical protein